MSSQRASVDRPFIGISTYTEASANWRGWEMPAALLPIAYVRMVQAAGGIAVMLPPDSAAVAWATAAALDGIVVAGGPDVDPARYGAERDLRTGPAAADRDAWELALIGAAVALKTPVLGICRGMQLLNIALGGTLTQHIDGHGHDVEGMYGSHRVTPIEGTRYHSLVPQATAVATSHHQAVDRLGLGLRVGAYAADGTIEAIETIEDRETPWMMGVQWHPEMGSDRRVVGALLRAARASKSQRELVS